MGLRTWLKERRKRKEEFPIFNFEFFDESGKYSGKGAVLNSGRIKYYNGEALPGGLHVYGANISNDYVVFPGEAPVVDFGKGRSPDKIFDLGNDGVFLESVMKNHYADEQFMDVQPPVRTLLGVYEHHDICNEVDRKILALNQEFVNHELGNFVAGILEKEYVRNHLCYRIHDESVDRVISGGEGYSYVFYQKHPKGEKEKTLKREAKYGMSLARNNVVSHQSLHDYADSLAVSIINSGQEKADKLLGVLEKEYKKKISNQ